MTQSDEDSDICEWGVPVVLGVPGVPGVPSVPHGPENCGEKCVTRSNAGGPSDRASNSCHSDMCTSPPGDSDICEDISGVLGVPGVPRVPGVPDVPHGSENCRAKCVTRSNAGGPGDRVLLNVLRPLFCALTLG